VPPAISLAHSRARESLTYISTLGIEKPRILEDMKRGELALARRQFKAASTRFTKVDKQAREVFKAALPDRLAQARDALRSLTKHRGKASGAKELFEAVEKAMDAGKYADAARHFRQAIRLIREGEHETVLRIMFSAKERFVLARKAGINIDGPLELMKISREKLKQGRLEEAVASAEAGQRLVEALLKKEHRSRGQLSECIKAIKVANLMGAGSEVLDERLNVVRAQFKSNELDGAYERARELTEIAKKAAYDKAASTYQMAEKALWMAKNLGLEDITDEDTLGLARQNLENDDTIQSFSLSTSVIVNTSSFILDSLNEKIKGVDQFAKGIEGEVMSLSEVQDAIEHTKERSVESFRKYSQLSEELVNQAFESAISYTRVSQDVIKEAFDNSVALAGDNATEGGLAGKDDTSTEIVSSSAVTPEDKRLRIVNLYLDGRITESQLERLLTLIDSSVAKVSLV
jgi:tetratricopeptide (TPR) repeat protein